MTTATTDGNGPHVVMVHRIGNVYRGECVCGHTAESADRDDVDQAMTACRQANRRAGRRETWTPPGKPTT